MKLLHIVRNFFAPPLLFTALTDTAQAPVRSSPGAIGYDLFVDLPAHQEGFSLPAGKRGKFPTNIIVKVPPGTYGRIAPRSGLAYNEGIDVLAGVIDPDYRGSVDVILLNTSDRLVKIVHGQRIAQLILERAVTRRAQKVIRSDLSVTSRGMKGFGSSGK